MYMCFFHFGVPMVFDWINMFKASVWSKYEIVWMIFWKQIKFCMQWYHDVASIIHSLATHWCWAWRLRLLWIVWRWNFNCVTSTCQKWGWNVTVVHVFARFYCHYKNQQEFQFGKEGYHYQLKIVKSTKWILHDFAARHVSRWPEITAVTGVNLGYASRHLSHAEGGQNSTTSAPVPGCTPKTGAPQLKLIKNDRNAVFGAWARTHDYILEWWTPF